MTENKLLRLLQTFTHQERQRFYDYLISPFYNQNKEIITFYTAIRPSLQKTKPLPLQEEAVWKKTFPGKKFNTHKYHRLSSDLLKQAERFMAVFRFSQNKTLEAAYILKGLNEKKLSSNFSYSLVQARKINDKEQWRESDYFYNRFLIESELYVFLESKNKQEESGGLKSLMENLDVFYIINKLKYCCAILHYQNVTAFDAELVLINEILEHLKTKSYAEIPVVNIYYTILLSLLESENENHFNQLKQLLERHQKELPFQMMKEMQAYATQYCIKKINAGQLNYYDEIFELYKKSLELNLLMNKGVFTHGNFKNIITVSLRLNEYKWTEDFIKKYSPFLPEDERENAFTFNMARVYFFQKKYDNVLNLLQQVEYNDVFYMLSSKLTLIKTFYELDEIDSLDALLDSFQMLLRRKKIISQQHRTIYIKFITYVKKMLRLTDKKKLKALRDEIHNARNVADLGWLKDKVNELV